MAKHELVYTTHKSHRGFNVFRRAKDYGIYNPSGHCVAMVPRSEPIGNNAPAESETRPYIMAKLCADAIANAFFG